MTTNDTGDDHTPSPSDGADTGTDDTTPPPNTPAAPNTPTASAQPGTTTGTQPGTTTDTQPRSTTSTPPPTTAITEHFGDRAQISQSFGDTTIDVAPTDWLALLTHVLDALQFTFFDWLTGVDAPPESFAIVAHVYNPAAGHRLLLRTHVPRDNPHLPTAVDIYRGANWHERETYEMFGVIFDGHPNLVPLLLPDGFEGHPLRKDFILAARVAKPWPGAKEPGESGHGAPSRRKTLPPGVPADWGPPDA
ncbi:NADH-quinone oxidoreductase subunit C [Nonomuraea gerenzanensis]|uniref:NADH-ubiquinone oxidoreductase chain C n=1 Tax=Nonomuraea gerenzanensis TaxID=93944 RepID=A0A1M4DYJ0_9ACTN|nr:NADH-quinone oxidoreductase subunit C [Nonomuraea gerenzanensis]UBU13964.1 NADH-quinone oxidoreductase subunit C [Nonomuraea gerenzanensis]SBO91649.1 NADH-ubiquinone oxidoreductase chain C [Nonomuraea gerenzanensis]